MAISLSIANKYINCTINCTLDDLVNLLTKSVAHFGHFNDTPCI